MDGPTNPLAVAGYVLGALISLPIVLACIKFIFFLARLDKNFEDLMGWMKEIKEWKHDVRDKHEEFELRIDRNTRDIERIREDLKERPA